MYCIKCGKFLAGNENFCSNCGTKVENNEVPKTKDVLNTKENKNDNIKMMSPVDEIVWDVKEFPSSENRRTEEVDFKWRSDDMFLAKEIRRANEAGIGSIVENEEIEEKIQKIEERRTLDSIEIPEIFKANKQEKPLERSSVTRNTTPIETEFVRGGGVVEIEQPSIGGVAFEVTKSDDEVKVERIIVDEPEMTSAVVDEAVIEEVMVAVEPEAEPEVEPIVETVEEQVEETVVIEESKPSLFEEIAPEAVTVLADARIDNEKKQIDKFYTFNRKKEEFQKLLDKEYERIEKKCEPGGFEEDIASFMEVSTGTENESTSQLEEMVRARELFFDDPFYIPKDEEMEETVDEVHLIDSYEIDEDLIADEPIETEEVAVAEEVVFEPESEQTLAEAFLESEAEVDGKLPEEEPLEIEETSDEELLAEELEKLNEEEKVEAEPEVASVIIDPSAEKKEVETTEDLAKEFFDDDDEDEERGRGGKVAAWILSIIIVIIAALLIVRIAMPEAGISKSMDKIADKSITFVQDLISGN